MSEHKPGCDGDSCEDYGCGMCDCCYFDFEDPKFVDTYPSEKPGEEFRFCALCTGTMTSTYFRSPRLPQTSPLVMMQTLCHTTNAILQALK